MAKPAILERLLRYRQAHGLGCYRRLVKVANGAITDDEIRRMAAAENLPLAKWTVLSAALDHIEKQDA